MSLRTAVYDICDVQDVFILDTQKGCYVWVGSGANATEKKNGFRYAHVSCYLVTMTSFATAKVSFRLSVYLV